MKISKLAAFFLFAFASLPVFADVYDYPSRLEDIVQKLPALESVKCKFKQEKTVQNLAKPLISGGDFEFVKDKGVYFHTTYPIEASVDYTGKNYKQINDIVNAISTKKYSRLEKEFNFYHTGTTDNWTLGMKPKEESAAANYISSITVKGSSYISGIEILQTNGNKTVIWFDK